MIPYQKFVLKALQAMTQGRLKLKLPNGSVQTFGNGIHPLSAKIEIQRDIFFKKVVWYGDIGLGESYTDGDWDTPDLTAVISWFILNQAQPRDQKPSAYQINWLKSINRFFHWMRDNHLVGSQKNIYAHYDLGNDFFSLFLDPTMTYSSAYFMTGDETLEEAQLQKYEALCRKLRLQASDHLLEIGSGWGGFAEYAGKKYGCKITSITISNEQLAYARKRIEKAGLSDRVEIKYSDYRKIEGNFDKIVSIEMIEAVGDRYLDDYFAACHRLLKPQGLFAIQMILIPDVKYETYRKDVDWIQKHIFPGSFLPSVLSVSRSLRRTGALEWVDFEDLSSSYALTLSKWDQSFFKERKAILALGFDESFHRKWHYYFSYCEAAFKMRATTVAQALFSRARNPTLTGAFPL